jgi:carboxyl-terminal processing protease
MKTPIISIILLITWFTAFAQTSAQFEMQKLNFSYGAITNFYVDKVDPSKLTEWAIKGMLDELDPHSSYLSAAEVKESTEALQGSFDGIGVSFNMVEDTLVVIQSITGGPSEKLGILPGDKIIWVNDTTIAGVKMKTSDITKRLKGPKGTQVSIKILRNKEVIPFTIVRDRIPIFSVDAVYMVDNKIGYIKVNRFASTTHQEVVDGIKKLKKKGMESLILDFQGNGGGYLQSAIELTDEFLPSKRTIVYTEGANHAKQTMMSRRTGLMENEKVIVLVDEYSASASEIVAGALQDWDSGVIIGRRTFGKGLVQRPIPMPDGSEIRLTVARYYTPSGRSIQRPYEKGKEKYEEDILERYKHGEFVSADSITFADSLTYTTLVTKRTVYGGGGIMPDIFVPADTTKYSPLHRELIRNHIITTTSITYTEKNRAILSKQFTTFDAFKKNFDTQVVVDAIRTEATTKNIAFTEEEWNETASLLAVHVKAIIARNLWSINEYFEIVNETNDFVKKAIEVLQNESMYYNTLQ